MLIQRHRRLVQIATGICLVLLLPFILFHLNAVNTRYERVHYEVVAALVTHGILDGLSVSSATLANKGENQSLSTEADLPIILASKFPIEGGNTICRIDGNYESAPVSFGCASLFVEGEEESAAVVTALDLVKRIRAPELLRNLYGIREAIQPPGMLPPILFTHLTFKTDYGMAMLVYPAVNLGKSYRLSGRPWFEKERLVGNLILSPLYHDYVTKAPTLTISRSVGSTLGQVRIGVDLRLSELISSTSVYFLNLLFASVAALLYWHSYLASKRRFIKFLLLSTLTLLLSYLVLTTIPFIPGSESWHLQKLKALVSLLPSGALLIVSGRSIRGRAHDIRKEIALWSSVEILCGLTSILAGSSIFAAAFGCVSLCTFGWCVLENRGAYDDPVYDEMSPHPITLSWYVFLAYSFWGGAQFALVLFSSEVPPVWRFISQFTPLGRLREILVGETGVFICLLYAKAIAFLFTTIYIWTIEGARYKKRLSALESSPFLQISPGGQIVGEGHLPGDFSKLRSLSFADLVYDPEDRTEISEAILNGREVRSYLCRLGRDFQGQLFRISIEREGEDGVRLITLRLVDKGNFLHAIDADLCNEVDSFVGELAGAMEGTDREGELRRLVFEKGPRIASKARSEVHAIAESSALETPKVDLDHVKDAFVRKLFHLLGVSPLLSLVDEAPLTSHLLPRRLRISAAVWDLVMDNFSSEIADAVLGGGTECLCCFGVIMGPDDSAPGGEDFVSFAVKINPPGAIMERYLHARQDEMLGFNSSLIQHGVGRRFAFIRYMLRVFGGEFVMTRVDRGGVECVFRLRYLMSSMRGEQ